MTIVDCLVISLCRLVIDVVDPQSGINGTSYQIIDQRSGAVVHSGFQLANKRDPPPLARKKRVGTMGYKLLIPQVVFQLHGTHS